MMNLFTMPYILEAKTYFWSPASHSFKRRANEERRQREVYDFFDSLGYVVDWTGNTVSATGEGLEVEFCYTESCNNVYKNLCVKRNGRRSNITSIRKVVKARNARFEKINDVLQAA